MDLKGVLIHSEAAGSFPPRETHATVLGPLCPSDITTLPLLVAENRRTFTKIAPQSRNGRGTTGGGHGLDKELKFHDCAGHSRAGVMVLGLSDGLQIAGYQVAISELPARIIAVVVGGLMIIASIWLEFSARRGSRSCCGRRAC